MPKPVDWQAWVAARRADIWACRDAAAIETFKQGMQMSYEATDKHDPHWRAPAEHRAEVARMVVERQQKLQRGR